ncbi:cytochrome b561 and DOMON domain-containing protein At5g47530 [Vigna angularis]|nr:cytochrome b561 and DOMON domain-containing protein At5g47530 [Vigna angularis]
MGSQAFVAIHTSNVTIRAYTSPKTSYVTMLQEGNLSFSVYSLSASYTRRPYSFSLSNLRSYGSINFISDKVSKVTKDVNSQTVLRNVHEIMMPIGVMMGRHLKVFDSLGDTWFHLHRACQSLAFFIAIVGFGTGLYIGKHYGVHHAPLQCVGIILMCLASAQICIAVFFGPKKDHKYKIFWNMFRYVVGYTTIALTTWNVLKGFDILNVENVWKKSYLGIIISLATIAITLEVITRILVCNNRITNS